MHLPHALSQPNPSIWQGTEKKWLINVIINVQLWDILLRYCTKFHHQCVIMRNLTVSLYRNKGLSDLPNDEVSLCQVLEHLKVTN